MDGDKLRIIITIVFFILIIISIMYNFQREGYININPSIESAPEITLITLASDVNGLGDYTPKQSLKPGEEGYIYCEYRNVCHDNQVQTNQAIAFFDIKTDRCYANIPVYFPLLECGEFYEKETYLTTWQTYCTDSICYTSVKCYVSSLYPYGEHKARVTITDQITGEETEATVFYTLDRY